MVRALNKLRSDSVCTKHIRSSYKTVNCHHFALRDYQCCNHIVQSAGKADNLSHTLELFSICFTWLFSKLNSA